MFRSEEFLTASPVARFFSRLAAKKSLFNDDDLEEELSYFPLPTKAIAECAEEKNGSWSCFNLKQKRILSESN